jgi:hypothetical protein
LTAVTELSQKILVAEYDDVEGWGIPEEPPVDVWQEAAEQELIKLFEAETEQVYFSRQLEVRFEDKYIHWITNRVIRQLAQDGFLKHEHRKLKGGSSIHLVWHHKYRYYKRRASEIVKLVEEYADPNIAGAVGLQGESMVLEGFARERFLLMGRNAREYRGRTWTRSDRNMDFIFEKDGKAYGVEVKNKLGYIDKDELDEKVAICKEIGIVPVFAVRMLPRPWIIELDQSGSFALILKYQLYPWGHKDLATRVRRELGLPVDSPRALEHGTMQRFIKWHNGL